MIGHYEAALDYYEAAKRAIRTTVDVEAADQALDKGRFALECLQAPEQGRQAPRRERCFFNPYTGSR